MSALFYSSPHKYGSFYEKIIFKQDICSKAHKMIVKNTNCIICIMRGIFRQLSVSVSKTPLTISFCHELFINMARTSSAKSKSRGHRENYV
jgi:hypothetical protein